MNMPIVSPERDLPTPGRGTRMIRFSAGSTLALTLALIAGPAFAATSHHASKNSTVRRVGHRIRHRIAHPMGQRGIAPERATQIQTALIHANYLTGSPSGQWDSRDRDGDAEVPGRSWLADQADAGFACIDCAWPWPKHRQPVSRCRRTPTGLPRRSLPKPEHWPPCIRSHSNGSPQAIPERPAQRAFFLALQQGLCW